MMDALTFFIFFIIFLALIVLGLPKPNFILLFIGGLGLILLGLNLYGNGIYQMQVSQKNITTSYGNYTDQFNITQISNSTSQEDYGYTLLKDDFTNVFAGILGFTGVIVLFLTWVNWRDLMDLEKRGEV